jgi:hypothetical protein
MGLLEIFRTQYVSAIAGAIGGVVTAWLTHRVLHKRGTFSYHVNHNRVGITTDDAVFGKVEASWNGNQIQNLYISNVELANESMSDYENVVVQVYTSDTHLLSESTQVANGPDVLEWTEKYKKKVAIPPSTQPTAAQTGIYFGQREYCIPVFNRGQTVRLTYLNSATTANIPTIWVAVAIKGVKLEFRVPQPLVLGVPKPQAAKVGILICLAIVVALLFSTTPYWLVALIALALGLIAQVPGAYAVRVWRKLYNVIGG